MTHARPSAAQCTANVARTDDADLRLLDCARGAPDQRQAPPQPSTNGDVHNDEDIHRSASRAPQQVSVVDQVPDRFTHRGLMGVLDSASKLLFEIAYRCEREGTLSRALAIYMRLKFCAVAASKNSSFAPCSPRSLSRSSLSHKFETR
jgi:hypothetical protein